MASSSSTPSSSSRSWKYDVFLSFRVEDTRRTFVDHLYSALVDRLIHTYKDDKALPRGDTIGPSLLNAIEESQIAIIIFSENYANSSWCLDELAYIMKCREERGLIVLPIFYHVEPTDVRKRRGNFGKAFAKHESENHNDGKVESWRKALIDAANIAGWEINHNHNGHEAKFIKDVVGSILDKLLYLNSIVDENLVGLGTRMQDLKTPLQIGSGGVRMVGIWGIGGGGKTTLATSIYIEISGKFDSCCFLGNVKDQSSKPNGIETLQEKILSTVLKTEVKVENVDIGKHTIKSRLGRKNVLLVLDDVDDCKQVEALAGSRDRFGDGSRIIITTRDEHLLRAHKVDEVSHVTLLSNDEAIRLFNKHAYNVNNLVEDYEMLSQHVVSYAGGLPLALKVLGSFLCDKVKDEWISTLNRLRDIPEMEIVKILKISYDGLTPLEKELFLDIACFFRGRYKDEAMKMLDACGFHPVIGVKVLIQKALITINSDGGFDMHDLVQEMGHYIVRGEHPNNPEKHSRLWQRKEINDICCTGNATTENNITEAIVISYYPSGFVKFLSKAKRLRLLYVLECFDENEGIDFLSNELRYMYWGLYPVSPFPESFQPRKLVVLNLESTWQEELWKGKKDLPCLKELHVSNAPDLVRAPDFGEFPCLEKLTLWNCPKLKMKEGNFNALKHLQECKIAFTNIRLKSLPCFLKRLTLIRCDLEDGDRETPFDIIGELSNLQDLDLSMNDFSRLNINLSQLSRLKLLNLSWCKNLVQLPKLPSSIAILKADCCYSLEVFVGDIINTNCKWLSQVSLSYVRSVIGGDRLLQTMLQGNATKNGCLSLELDGVEIPKGFTPPLLRGGRYTLELSENWYNHFSGFLFCAAVGKEFVNFDRSYQTIIMKHDENGGLMNSKEKNVYWEESVYDKHTWIMYVSFASLKHTTWWDPTSTNIQFFLEKPVPSSGFGVCLVSKTSETVCQLQTTVSSSYNDYKYNFLIHHDSRSHLEGKIEW